MKYFDSFTFCPIINKIESTTTKFNKIESIVAKFNIDQWQNLPLSLKLINS